MRRKPQRILILLTGGVLSFILLEETLNISEFAYRLMDRDPNLTSRTYIWDVLTEMVTNKLIGTGYQSFWTGDRVDAIVNTLGAEINQAHNGYIEQYLNLGYIGLFFIVVMVFSGLLKAQREMMVYPPWGILKLCIIATAMVYNYAEASFYGINNMWLLLLLACIEIPFRLAVGSAASAYAPTDRESRLSARARRPAAGRRQAEGVSRPRALGRRRGVGEPPK
jgi:O-antigen ligase